MGFYPPDQFEDFVNTCREKYRVSVRYIEENQSNGPLGTAGGLLRFRSELLKDDTKAVFVLNADVCGDLPIVSMVQELDNKPTAQCLILTTEATRDQSRNFGCVSHAIASLRVKVR